MSHIAYSLYNDNDLIESFDSIEEAERAKAEFDQEHDYEDELCSLIDEIAEKNSDLTTNPTDLNHNDVCLLNMEGKIDEFRKKWAR